MMASSHNLVTVCMFCLLCASHTTCSAHPGAASGLTDQELKKSHNVRHERFKVDAGKPKIEDVPHPAKESLDESQNGSTLTNSLVMHYLKMNSKSTKRIQLNKINREKISEGILNIGDNRVKGTTRDEGLHIMEDSLRRDELRRRLHQGNDELDSTYLNSDEKRKRNKRDVSADYADALYDVRDRESNPQVNNQRPVNEKKNVGYADALDDVRDRESNAQLNNRNRNERLNSSTGAPLNRKRRDAHIPDNQNKEHKDPTNNYKANIKNIDVDFYIKKLFSQFGNDETMTMDLSGFERMLKRLDLDRMILESKILTPHPEMVDRGVRENPNNATCINSADLVSSLNAQQKHARHSDRHTDGHKHVEDHDSPANASLDIFKSKIKLNAKTLWKACPILLYQRVANTSYERSGCVIEQKFTKTDISDDDLEMRRFRRTDPSDHSHANDDHDAYSEEGGASNRVAVWTYSGLCILAISACGLLGVAVIPIMENVYYKQILQFLVALAVGTLCGDALLHLLPHAMSPHGKSSHEDSMWKGLVAMLGVVFFYFTEKGLTLVAEWRKRRMRMDKENKLPSRVRVMRDDIGCLKGSGSCSSERGPGFLKLPSILKSKPVEQNNVSNSVPSSNKICKHKYSEYPYCYDEIATDTHDDHHVRDGRSSSKEEQGDAKMAVTEELLSVVSGKALHHDEGHRDGDACGNGDSGVNDSLLPSENNHRKPIEIGNSIGHEEEKNKMNDVINDILFKKNLDPALLSNTSAPLTGQEESYTVILREHSQTHHGHSHSHGHVHSPPSSLSSVVWMVIMGDGIHNFTDGMAIGAAFSSNIAGGFSTAIAVLCHELPHEIGDFAVLLKAGMSAKRAVCYNLLSSLLCLLGMVVGVLAGHTPEATEWIFAAAAGMFLYIALVDMIPELSSSHSNEGGSFCQCVLQLTGLLSGIGIMLLIAIYEHDLKRLFG